MRSFLSATIAGLTLGVAANASVIILDTKSGSTTCVDVSKTDVGWNLTKVDVSHCDAKSSQLIFSKALDYPRPDENEFIPILLREGAR